LTENGFLIQPFGPFFSSQKFALNTPGIQFSGCFSVAELTNPYESAAKGSKCLETLSWALTLRPLVLAPSMSDPLEKEGLQS